MKNLFVLTVFLFSFALTACSGNAKENAGQTPVVSQTPAKGADVKVKYLNTAQFKKLVWDYKKNPGTFVYEGKVPCIIDFYADWCRPCKMVAPIMEQLAKEYNGKLIIYKVNTDLEQELSSVFQIRSIPAILYVPRTGKPQMAVGAQSKAEYVEAIRTILNVK